jgi:HEAT repeat protein
MVVDEPMGAEQAAALAEFARSCKSALRAVSLYPGTHPAIGVSLSRVVTATTRVASTSGIALTVAPRVLLIDGRAPAKPDIAVVELATLLHERLIGTLRVEREADSEDWRQFLLLASRAPEDLIARGGIAQAWSATGRAHFAIGEIDYAEVLKEREGREGAAWDRVIAYCLRGESVDLDEATLQALLEAVQDTARFGALLERLQEQADDGAAASMRVAALFQLLKTTLDALAERHGLAPESILDTVAANTPRLRPEMLLGILERRDSSDPREAAIASGIIERIDADRTAAFVAQSVATDRGATERLALAFAALVPEPADREQVLDRARTHAEAGELGRDPQFEELWPGAAEMLVSYSDAGFVSTEYARELSSARTQAIEVERLTDDPPDRIQTWLASVSESALFALDLDLFVDLLRLTEDPADWERLAGIVVSEIERRVLVGEFSQAAELAARIVTESGASARPAIVPAATRALEHVSSGSLVRQVVAHFHKANDREVANINALCLTVGPSIVRRLAEALTIESHTPTIRRLRELLLAFGPAGRQAVEPLKNSNNPAVRRTAIDLLRVFGGNEALRELTSMLGDADPEVQRESVRAIVQISTPEAHAVMQRALDDGDPTRDMVVRQLIALRDDRAVPLLCHVVATTVPRARLVETHEAIFDALSLLGPHEASTAVLQTALHRGEWWAPVRTSRLRRAAAAALQRIASPETHAVLADAAASGARGVRKAVREIALRQPATPPRYARER